MMIAEINENGKNEWNDERTTPYIIEWNAHTHTYTSSDKNKGKTKYVIKMWEIFQKNGKDKTTNCFRFALMLCTVYKIGNGGSCPSAAGT